MASVNTMPPRVKRLTHEGAPAAQTSTKQDLRRAVLSCLLWENSFYESGVSIAERITTLASGRPPQEVAALAIEARAQMHLRHVPLLLLNVLTKTGSNKGGGGLELGNQSLVADTFEAVIQRADEMAEFLAIYWKDGKHPISNQAKKGLARAFKKFDGYQLAKYQGKGDKVTLRDVMFLSHPKGDPREASSADTPSLFKRIADKTLEAPDTWEVNLSAGKDKKETFERLLREGNLGYLALLRNLRGMAEAGVETPLIQEAILARKGAHNVLPFRYIAALRAAPQFLQPLDTAMQQAVSFTRPWEGKTCVLVDISGSMDTALSVKSDMTRIDAACALAVFVPGQKRVFSFSAEAKEVPAYPGMAGIDAIAKSQHHNVTNLGAAILQATKAMPDYSRIVVITDEQSHDPVGAPPMGTKGYMINVASYQNGVGHGPWNRIEGFSENVLRYITELEADPSLDG